MQRGPNWPALRTPLQFLTGCGSRQRRSPTGGWPKGMPLKLRTPSWGASVDSRMPLAVLTRSAATDGGIATAQTAMAGRINVEAFIEISTHQDSNTGREWAAGREAARSYRGFRPVAQIHPLAGSRKTWASA